MSFAIRTFLNTDIPMLAQIWRDHHQAVGLDCACVSNVWEYCILNKPFFDPESLWIVEYAGEAIGFLHATLGSTEDGSDVGRAWGLVNALCVRPHPEEERAVDWLLEAVDRYWLAHGCSLCLATSSPHHQAFYLGIAHGDGLLGVPVEDLRLRGWLGKRGWEAAYPNEWWEIDLTHFRPPMDRQQIQIRRQCQVSRLLDAPPKPWWEASAWGHAEELRFQLQARQAPLEVMELTFWQPDPTIYGLGSRATLLSMPPLPGSSLGMDRMGFLLAESLRQLQQERVGCVRVVVDMERSPCVQILQRLGFRSIGSGLTLRHP